MESVSLADAMGKLDSRQQHVIRERLAGRTYGDIVRDREMRFRGRRVTRPGVATCEKFALRKLGCRTTIAKAVYAAERFDRAMVMRERGRLRSFEGGEGALTIIADSVGRKAQSVCQHATRDPAERVAADLEKLAERLLRECLDGRPLSAERAAWYQRQGLRITARG